MRRHLLLENLLLGLHEMLGFWQVQIVLLQQLLFLILLRVE